MSFSSAALQSRICSRCNRIRDKSFFSNHEWSKCASRCNDCFVKQCRQCKRYKLKSQFGTTEWKKGEGLGFCLLCSSSRTESEMKQCSKCDQMKHQGDFSIADWAKNATDIRVCNQCSMMRCRLCRHVKERANYGKAEWRRGENIGVCNTCQWKISSNPFRHHEENFFLEETPLSDLSKTCSKCKRVQSKGQFTIIEWSKSEESMYCVSCMYMTCGNCKRQCVKTQFQKEQWELGSGVGHCNRCVTKAKRKALRNEKAT